MAIACLCRYGGALYGFSSSTALQAFADAPATTLDAVRQAVRNAPLLAHTMGLTSMAAAAAAGGAANSTAGSRVGFAGSAGRADGSTSGGTACAVLPLRRLVALVSQAPVQVDAETQTPTHFTERLIDVNYEWNEWALRRRVSAKGRLHALSVAASVCATCAQSKCTGQMSEQQAAANSTKRGFCLGCCTLLCLVHVQKMLAPVELPQQPVQLSRLAAMPTNHSMEPLLAVPLADHCACQPAHQGHAQRADGAEPLQARR
jgi:hypothetical protein